MHTLLLLQLILLALSVHVIYCEQYEPCLATAKNQRLNHGYTFALAKVKDTVSPLGPQEACYFSCGARIVTHSTNKGDMNKLTAMDSAAPYLSIIDFLKIGQSYFVNHLGLKEEEGGTGIGCMHVESLKSAKYYPRNHPLCQKADTAICGFWGTQPVPEAKDKMSP